LATNNNSPLNKQLQAGIAAAKAGDKDTARQLLEGVLAADDRNELAWIWMASVVSTNRERRVCLENVLQINPANERARQALNQMVSAVSTDDVPKVNAPIDPTRLQQTRANPNGNRNIWIVLGVFGVIVVLISLLGGLFSPSVAVVATTNTPIPPEQLALIVSPTPLPPPSATFPPPVFETAVPITLPPTFTPTATHTPPPTFTPSATPFPLGSYTLLYTSRGQGESVLSLNQILADGSGQQPLLENVRDFVFDTTGEQVAFVRDVTYTNETTEGEATAEASAQASTTTVGEVFLANANDLANARQVTNLRTASVFSPVISPNGQQIAFVSDYLGNDDIFVFDLPTGVTTQLTDDPNSDQNPSWSPDGTQIVFASDRNSPLYYDIFLVSLLQKDANGKPLVTRFNDERGSSYAPQFSPNGKTIVYLNDVSGTADIYVVGADGQRKTVLVGGASEERNPVWSPDGRFIGFVSNREEGIFQIYLAEIATGTIVRVNRDGRETQNMQFRPDLIFRLLGKDS
jgi:WD40 repeat protein